ncbi:beta-N-acetylhexosaminidase [Methyloterricola oryzae]|uniref:beta-N-acetylhexosaminidase n=1 Tax=Methyloterricola oryzae TaxID=1495050 RepID=UPI000A5AF3EC|nr:beta-N-acetylhexosaminidase [Methyloterricola oryzae]
MLDLKGTELLPEERERLQHPTVGALILFSRNFESPDQLAELNASVRAARPGILVAVDHEGGRVQRFREGFTRLPPAARYADYFGSDEAALHNGLEDAGWLMASELLAVGVDFSFAPVLDVDCGISQVIGDRSFARDAESAGRCAQAFAHGMRGAGMAAVGKHFPGHGAVSLDSHHALPEDKRSYAEIAAKDLVPFRRLIADGLEGVMPAHVVYSQLDSRPAGFSSYWIGHVLRGELGFDGAVFSDDLSMAGAAFAGDFGQRASMALEAGCDMVLVCNDPDAAAQVLDHLPPAPAVRQDRLIRMRARAALDAATLRQTPRWQDAHAWVNRMLAA